ncbi:aldo/keto reductase [Streptomyces spectabilis]|uniref:aldo/keto reductase n=1 Tax=Streptomyces spectabilis TaxID=68270 RepID=UPI001679D841|nr:aldo/keto reductase [Streptomyces spectabilis]
MSAASSRRCGASGLHLSPLGLGLGSQRDRSWCSLQDLIAHAVEIGISHFDITLTPGSLYGTEDMIRHALAPWRSRREEIVITARIGLGTPGGQLVGFGSRKRLLSGLDCVLHRMGLEYIDILYAHRHDHTTPLRETAQALASAVHQGKALYAGLSAFSAPLVQEAADLLNDFNTPLTACQTSYSLLDRWAEGGFLAALEERGIGAVACAPLAHGALSGASTAHRADAVSSHSPVIREMARIAAARAQPLEQLAISWALRDPRVCSVLMSTSCLSHLTANRIAMGRVDFTVEELDALDACCPGPLTADTQPYRERSLAPPDELHPLR